MTQDALFQHIERHQAARPWGRILDAGTGVHSLKWLLTLPSDGVVGVTADEDMRKRVAADVPLRPQDALVIGNWTDDALLRGQQFHTVLADYLVGALDGFAPYFQDVLFDRLRPAVQQTLYVVGWEPLLKGDDEGAAYLAELYRFRDACMLMADVRPYREYPADWAVRMLRKSGFFVEDVRQFPIIHGEASIERQVRNATNQLCRIKNPTLVKELENHAAGLRARGLALIRQGPIHAGSDYVVCARREDVTPG